MTEEETQAAQERLDKALLEFKRTQDIIFYWNVIDDKEASEKAFEEHNRAQQELKDACAAIQRLEE